MISNDTEAGESGVVDGDGGVVAHEDNGGDDTADGTERRTLPPSNVFRQDPVAIVGFACRLPDNCSTPRSFWRLLNDGGIATTTPPQSRFSIKTHYGSSRKGKTMASPGGMFLQSIDLADMDAQFFKLSRSEALSMDPQQRQLLEVIYEGMENAGATLEELSGKPVGCFVASFACDYGDMQARDPEDRAPATVVGIGRAMLSNRISHFLNVKGPSMTIDTACSGSLTCLDVACRYLQTREIGAAIIAGCNLYLSPEHVMGVHSIGGTASPSGRCHTFDAKADGYIKAEAANMMYIKRLDDALAAGDPVRAVIRGTATNSDGWTAGIASPNSDAQAQVIRQAYANAGISDLSATSYVEFHGTGTRAGDVIEARGVASVFGPSRAPDKPLRIGSVKANIGHSEPGAGISGLLKTVLALEKGIIPGNPTFVTPNPGINFAELRLLPSRTATKWPSVPLRRASVNSFGYGGSNTHVVVDAFGAPDGYSVSSHPEEAPGFLEEDEPIERPYVLVFSANDDQSLRAQYAALDRHLCDPGVSLRLRDLAYTLSERRSRHYCRGYTISSTGSIGAHALVTSNARAKPPRIGYVFTGQGAQWSQMGKPLVSTFPAAAEQVKYLDSVLQAAHNPPDWKLFDILTEPCDSTLLKHPVLSQTLCTALQLAMLCVLETAGVSCHAVAGHSSGEIAAATAAGVLTPAQAIKIAYYRGESTSAASNDTALGMLAVGLGADQMAPYLLGTSVEIACFNSPASVTLSGASAELQDIELRLRKDGRFARLLQVTAAYHSKHMVPAAQLYRQLLERHVEWPEASSSPVALFSTTTAKRISGSLGPDYWVRNMVSPVLFDQAVSAMLSESERPDVLIEIGPSNVLAGPVNQIKTALSEPTVYMPMWKRGPGALDSLLGLAGELFNMGSPLKLNEINKDRGERPPSFIMDLPNYSWNHSTKYWYENDASVDWRFRAFAHHELLGGKILGLPWTQPTWRKVLKLQESPWLRGHSLLGSVIFPASAFVAMAIEAIFQRSKALGQLGPDAQVNQSSYLLRDILLQRALPLDTQGGDTKVLLSLTPCFGTSDSWQNFAISSVFEGIVTLHCRGRVRIMEDRKEGAPPPTAFQPFRHPTPAATWYKALRDAGYTFGPDFLLLRTIETTAGSRRNRARLSLITDHTYPLHPRAIDACFQAGVASLWRGDRSSVQRLIVPAAIDELEVKPQGTRPKIGIAVAEARYGGVGREDDPTRYRSDVDVYDEGTRELVLRLQGLRYDNMDGEDGSSHAYAKVIWRPDVELLPAESLAGLLDVRATEDGDAVATKLRNLIELMAHKKPGIRILEANLVGSRSVWIDRVRPALPPDMAALCEYVVYLPSQSTSMDALTKYAASGITQIGVHDPEKPFSDMGLEVGGFDLLILTAPRPYHALQQSIAQAREILSGRGYVVVLQDRKPAGDAQVDAGGVPRDEVGFPPWCSRIPVAEADSEDLTIVSLGPVKASHEIASGTPSKEVHLVHFRSLDGVNRIAESLSSLYGWHILEHALPLNDLADGSTVLVLDEVFSPVISSFSDEEFLALQSLTAKKCRLLWVTAGAQMGATHPEHSLFLGSARSFRSEDPSALLLSLDVESAYSRASVAGVNTAIGHLKSVDTLEFGDSEFAERSGVLHVSRIVPDELANKLEKDAVKGPEPQLLSFHSNASCVRLVSDRPGSIDSLHWAESHDLDALEDDMVAIDVHAASLNFKDLANAMGFVPANERMIGVEASGIVSGVGKDVRSLHIGDRVFVLLQKGGCLANRVKQVEKGIQHIPDWMSFEDAATLGVCFATAVRGLIDLAAVQRGEIVLIHSAAGGVGSAAIQLCRYLGAEIYVTVGSEDKRKFLADTYGISRDRMFSSRSITFAADVMEATHGHGADVILNSLAGDMLHESWRCIAANGRFVEIGKRDMLERRSLSMEPFTRNATYSAFDLSIGCTSIEKMHNVLTRVTELVGEGHLKPLHRKTFPFAHVIDAFRYLRGCKHVGKIVITDSGTDRSSIRLLATPALPTLQLKQDRSYLICGGLKGLCGSLAVYLARHGAKHLVVLSRSGYDDDVSRGVVHHLEALGAAVDLVRGDVTVKEDVRAAFRSGCRPVAGIIHGAMVLQDKLFPSMSPQEFRDPIGPKVRGTWNLHHVSQEQGPWPLDFFTLLSSISGVCGQSAQANYCAGSVFQDAFAAYRRTRGLPACAVDLGLIEDVGYFTSRDRVGRRLLSKGWPPINEAQLHRILRLSILLQQRQGHEQAASSQLITGLPVPLLPSSPVQPHNRFSALRPPPTATGGGDLGVGSPLAVVRGGEKHPAEARLAAAVEVVGGQLKRSLGLSEPPEALRPLAAYGIDSLVVIELRNWARAELGVELYALDVMSAKTLVGLCEVILKKL